MKQFFKEIFEYQHILNQKLLTEINVHVNKLPERTLPLFCHILNAHQVWNSRILNFQSHGVWDVHTPEACADIDKKNYADTLKVIESVELERTIAYKTFKGQEFSNSVRDMLFHVSNHSTHHKGQIVADFRQCGVEPLVTDYIFFKR